MSNNTKLELAQGLTLGMDPGSLPEQHLRCLTLNVIRPGSPTPYLFMAWNVNGYSDKIHEWLLSYVGVANPDVIFLSETKKKPEVLNPKFNEFVNYNYIINVHSPSQWHGVAILIRKDHSYKQIEINLGIPVRGDNKSNDPGLGRILAIHFNEELYLIGSYTPNSGNSDPVKLQYRTQIWDPAFFNLLQQLHNLGPTIWLGDVNVARDDIDVSNPKSMSKNAGYTPEERYNFHCILNSGDWIDIWRYQHPSEVLYSWCGRYRTPTVHGMRLDNILLSKSLLPRALNSFMIPDCSLDTDHIPVCTYISRK